jgi:hypothetical protein
MNDSGNAGLTFRVPVNSVGQVYSFTGYCSFDKQKSVTIAIEVVDVPATEGGGTTGDGTTGGDTGTVDEAVVSPEIAIVNTVDGVEKRVPGPALPTFSSADGAQQTYTIFVKPDENAGTWIFDYETNSDDYRVEFTSPQLTVESTNGEQDTTSMKCYKGTTELFTVTFNVIVQNLEITAKLYEIDSTTKENKSEKSTATYSTPDARIIFVPYTSEEKHYKIVLTDNHNDSSVLFTAIGNEFIFSNKDYKAGDTIKTLNARCAPYEGTGYTLTVPITIKVAD